MADERPTGPLSDKELEQKATEIAQQGEWEEMSPEEKEAEAQKMLREMLDERLSSRDFGKEKNPDPDNEDK